jgi:MerR family transcriptional regulator/heat shock protein HspR
MAGKDEPLYMISIVAQMLSIHPQTLRLYEREGFIKPSRTNGNTRLYSPRDVEKLQLILRLTRELGINLAGVEVILGMREKMKEMQEELNRLREELAEATGGGYVETGSSTEKSLTPSPPGKIIKVDIET